MLSELRRSLRECTSCGQVVRILSKDVRDRTKDCVTPLLFMRNKTYGSTVCFQGERFESTTFLSDEYIRLRTIDGCDLSIIGISEDRSNIEITSDTVKSQQRKGYNTIMRAVAVIISFVRGKDLRSEITNKWSAYSLLKDYQVTVVWKGGKEENMLKPMSCEDAKQLMNNCKRIFIRPTVENLNNATRILTRSSLKCADL